MLHSEQTVNKNTLQGDSNSAKYRLKAGILSDKVS